MITFKQGDLFQDQSEALVNPVNCVGIMGKGLALEFKSRFPDNFREYNHACRIAQVRPGQMFVFNTYEPKIHQYIINFPTKRHWGDTSRIEDIQTGIQALAEEVRSRRITSIAIPALGSGLGGLRWNEVRSIIESGLRELEEMQITVYEPRPAPSNQEAHPESSPGGTRPGSSKTR